MAIPTEGNWCHIWNSHSSRWEVVVATAFGARVAILCNPDDDAAYADARLLAASKDLLELAREYASKCESCAGSGEIIRGDPGYEKTEQCGACRQIWDLVSKAEGA
jgi:hypothetical protein